MGEKDSGRKRESWFSLSGRFLNLPVYPSPHTLPFVHF